MSIFRAILEFFKTWFLPTPAHDDPRFAQPEGDSPAPLAAPAAVAAEITEPEQDFHAAVMEELDADDGDIEHEPDDPDYPKQVPMHPIAPPEGADERASRSSAATNPFSIE